MTIDELQDEARRAIRVAVATGDDRLYRLAGIVDQLVDFIEGSAFRTLSNAGVRNQSKRDREVVHCMFGHLRSLVMYAATAQLPSPDGEVHDVACPLQVGEACNCEPIIVEAESS